MARKSNINWTRLSASPQLPTGTDGTFTQIDLSAYVDPLHSKAFKIVDATMILMSDDVPYGVLDSSQISTHYTSIGMQIATGTQVAILRPSDGKVLYHNAAGFFHDADAGTNFVFQEVKVTDLWPDGYMAVVDTLTAGVDTDTTLGANFRIMFSITGYQVSVTSNQLASLLVAQTA